MQLWNLELWPLFFLLFFCFFDCQVFGSMKPDLQKVKLFAEIIPCQMVLLRKTF